MNFLKRFGAGTAKADADAEPPVAGEATTAEDPGDDLSAEMQLRTLRSSSAPSLNFPPVNGTVEPELDTVDAEPTDTAPQRRSSLPPTAASEAAAMAGGVNRDQDGSGAVFSSDDPAIREAIEKKRLADKTAPPQRKKIMGKALPGMAGAAVGGELKDKLKQLGRYKSAEGANQSTGPADGKGES